MKKRFLFFILFVFIQISLIFLHIHKNSLFVKESYRNQKLENQKKDLSTLKDRLLEELYEIKSQKNVKKFAQDELKMQKLNLNQVKRLG
ncbi:MAG: hypothetical protein UR26_C0001G0018 [candidate division TM6 bacterium GW2011_GWF2_32_72]|nr:MAG: hypothetical protein UR26_C0001G0018 [candidate division TM6 bacterium GW2011_GWF2_32_72]